MKTVLLLFFCSGFLMAYAADDIYHFDSNEQQQVFSSLTHQLRCLVCQNQSLADSNSALADDLRQQIYRQVLTQKSESEIVHYMVERYGDFVLYQPPIRLNTVLLWFGPGFLLLFGCGYLLWYIHRQVGGARHE